MWAISKGLSESILYQSAIPTGTEGLSQCLLATRRKVPCRFYSITNQGSQTLTLNFLPHAWSSWCWEFKAWRIVKLSSPIDKGDLYETCPWLHSQLLWRSVMESTSHSWPTSFCPSKRHHLHLGTWCTRHVESEFHEPRPHFYSSSPPKFQYFP